MRLLTAFVFLSINTALSQDWSDTIDLNENSLIAFVGESKDYGYKQSSKIVIKPKFEDAYNFHGEYASAKFNGRWGIINAKGKWKIRPSFDFISPIVQSDYIMYQDSVFYLCNTEGAKQELGRRFKIDYLQYMTLLSESHDPDKDLIKRIVQINDPLNAHNQHRNPEPTYEMLSRYMTRYYWSTKWLIEELNP